MVSPDKVQARKMVLVGVLLLAIISVYRAHKGSDSDKSQFQRLWAVAVVGMILSLLADFAPKIAGPFAILMVLGSLTSGGDKVIGAALGVVDKKNAGAGSNPARSGTAPATPTPQPAS